MCCSVLTYVIGSTLVGVPKSEEHDSQVEYAFYSYVKVYQE